MATYYVDDGGDNTTGADWATAYTSIASLDAARSLSFGDIIYVGHDHLDAYAYAGSLTLNTTSQLPAGAVRFVSATQGSDPPTYQKSTAGWALDVGGGANRDLVLNGSSSWHGLRVRATGHIYCAVVTGGINFSDCTLSPGPAKTFYQNGNNSAISCFVTLDGSVLDFAQDTGSTGVSMIYMGGQRGSSFYVNNLSLANVSNRTGLFLDSAINSHTAIRIENSDLSNLPLTFPSGRPLVLGSLVPTQMINCRLPFDLRTAFMDQVWHPPTPIPGEFINCGETHDPTFYVACSSWGQLRSSTDVYRSGGAAIDFVPFALQFIKTTTRYSIQWTPSPLMIGVVEAGTKTFTVSVVNDLRDLTDAEMYLEIDFLSASGYPTGQRVTTRLTADIETGAAALAADSGSTWNGAGPAFTYKQKLSLTAAVGQSGMYRARVYFAVQIAAASNCFLDPKVIVS